MVSVTLKNTSGKRQRQEDAWVYLVLSKLVDSKGNKYDTKERESKYDINLAGKPFAPGEARSIDLLFDTPKGIKADKFIITNEKLEDIALKL
ncbi:hypothetical protein NIES2100_36250 [Calothrix sp. NIES-2100]|nr:hypothetical protein NIES2100_36250 [Calothrix sp. NIES-2100]